MGQTGGKSLLGGGCTYDEGYTISLIYNAFDKLLEENKTLADIAVATNTPRIVEGLETGVGNLHHQIKAADTAGRGAGRRREAENAGVKSVAAAAAAAAQPPPTEPASSPSASVPASSSSSSPGSCFCYCPPGEGYGHCFDLPSEPTAHPGAASNKDHKDPSTGMAEGARNPLHAAAPALPGTTGDEQCVQYQRRAADFCPSTGIVRQCGGATRNCTDEHDWISGMDCSVVEPCPAGKPLPFDSMTCHCRPAVFDCYYQPGDTCEAHRKLNPHFRRPIGKKFKQIPRF